MGQHALSPHSLYSDVKSEVKLVEKDDFAAVWRATWPIEIRSGMAPSAQKRRKATAKSPSQTDRQTLPEGLLVLLSQAGLTRLPA